LLTELGSILYQMHECSGGWDSEAGVCAFIRVQAGFSTAITVAVCDSVLVFTMLFGLLRRRPAYKNRIWHILWHQGLLWLIIVSIAEIPTILIVHLNFNEVIDLTTIPPEIYIIAVGAMRLYRSLHIVRQEEKPDAHHMVILGQNPSEILGRLKLYGDSQNADLSA